MAVTCETCGNETDDPIEVSAHGKRHSFDSFQCAIDKMAPRCEKCGCAILGPVVTEDDSVFCSRGCAEQVVPAEAAHRYD